jgi:hypothetical protein
MSKAVNAVKSFFGTDFNFGSIANVLCEYTLFKHNQLLTPCAIYFKCNTAYEFPPPPLDHSTN